MIAHISTTFNHRAGGTARLFKRLKAMRDHGYTVVLIVGRDYDPSPDWDMSGIEIYRIPSLIKYLNAIKDLRAFGELIRVLHAVGARVVHTHLAKAGILGRWAAYLCRTPTILHTVHGPTFPSTLPLHKRLPYLCLEWITAKITDHFVFVGEDVREEYMRCGVCSTGKSFIIRTGRPDAEIDALKQMGEEERAKLRASFSVNDARMLIVNVGRIVPSKSQDHAIRVVQELRRKGVPAHLALVGEGLLKEEKGYMATLVELVKQLGMAEHVTFTGHRTDALKIMAASDAVLHTSRYEGLPNVLVEAAMAGRPVVSYAVSGAREVILDGETGFIVPQRDIMGATEKLHYLATHPEKAREMGRRASERISDEYRESSMIRGKLDLYDRLFSGVPQRESSPDLSSNIPPTKNTNLSSVRTPGHGRVVPPPMSGAKPILIMAAKSSCGRPAPGRRSFNTVQKGFPPKEGGTGTPPGAPVSPASPHPFHLHR